MIQSGPRGIEYLGTRDGIRYYQVYLFPSGYMLHPYLYSEAEIDDDLVQMVGKEKQRDFILAELEPHFIAMEMKLESL